MVNYTSETKVNHGRKSELRQNDKLTLAEQEVYHLLTVGKLWPAQIARRRKTSKAAVSKIMTSLRQKGFLNKVNGSLVNYTCTPLPAVNHAPSLPMEHPVRLHGEEWRVGILRSSEKYVKVRQKPSLWVDGNRVVPYRDCVMVFSYQSFEGVDPDGCERLAGPYWLRFFTRLEHELGIMVLKNRSHNVIRVKAHYAELGNELADDLRKRKEKLRVFGTRDGKEWMLFDDSHPGVVGNEAETTHSPTSKDGRTAHEDMQGVVQPFFNDLRDNPDRVALPSVTQEMLHSVARLLGEQQQVNLRQQEHLERATNLISFYGENVATHVPVMREMARILGKMEATIGKQSVVRHKDLQMGLGRWQG